MNIRQARPEDSEAIYVVYTAAVRTLCKDHYNPAQLEALTGCITPQSHANLREDQLVLVAEETDGPIVGYAHLDVPRGGVEAVFVHPDFGRRRVGSRLMQALEEAAHRTGIIELNLDASLNAIPFYEWAGFHAEQRITPRLNGVEMPFMSMRKTLVAETN